MNRFDDTATGSAQPLSWQPEEIRRRMPPITSLAFVFLYDELAIKIVAHNSIYNPTGCDRVDISLVHVNERDPDFAAVARQLEAIHRFKDRGLGVELWYTDRDGDQLRITDWAGLVYACEDWRYQVNRREWFFKRSMRIYINETVG